MKGSERHCRMEGDGKGKGEGKGKGDGKGKGEGKGDGKGQQEKGVPTLARRERARGVAAAFCTASAWPAASLGKLAMGPSYDPVDRQTWIQFSLSLVSLRQIRRVGRH